MTEQIKKWFQAFSTTNLISSRDIFEDYICDGCENDLVQDQAECLWTGQKFGMCDYTICSKCYSNGKYNNMNRCDFMHWKMFQLSDYEIEKFKDNWIEPEDTEFGGQIRLTREQKLTIAIDKFKNDYRAQGLNQCQKFDLGTGWYRRVEADEDLCQYHSKLIMASSEPDQNELILLQTPLSQTPLSQTPLSQTPLSQTPLSQTPLSQTKFQMVTSHDLNQIHLSDDAKFKYYENGRGGIFFCEPCELILPSCIPDEQYLAVNQSWFGIDNEQLLPMGWETLVSCNGIAHSAMSDKFIMLDPMIGNIAQWVPFDESNDPVGLEDSDGVFALVNCNPVSENYLQTLTIITDNHGRSSADLTGLNIEEYLKQKQSYESQIDCTLPDTARHEIYSCDICQSEPIIGRRYQCCSREDLCANCYSVGKHCNYAPKQEHVIEEQKWHPLDFIEFLRKKLGQGFYYG
jgi:hypothetical protein